MSTGPDGEAWFRVLVGPGPVHQPLEKAGMKISTSRPEAMVLGGCDAALKLLSPIELL